jgi:hypothetical protein
MDFDQYNFDKLIMEKIIPSIKREREKFLIQKKNNNNNNNKIRKTIVYNQKKNKIFLFLYCLLYDLSIFCA